MQGLPVANQTGTVTSTRQVSASQVTRIKIKDARFSSCMKWLSQLHLKLSTHILEGQLRFLSYQKSELSTDTLNKSLNFSRKKKQSQKNNIYNKSAGQSIKNHSHTGWSEIFSLKKGALSQYGRCHKCSVVTDQCVKCALKPFSLKKKTTKTTCSYSERTINH